MNEQPSLIGVDWGTSSFRAYLLHGDGIVQDRVDTRDGILTAAPRGFATVLAANIGQWRAAQPEMPIVMSGMIGSRQGWREAPYVSCPAHAGTVAAALTPVVAPELGRVLIVPGLATTDANALPDVMRGEETQIFGALAAMQRSTGVLVLPGTHSKWARVEEGRVMGFATYMTGEVYAALRGHTILGALMSEEQSRSEAFDKGVTAAARLDGGPGQLLHAIFSTRTLALFDRIAPQDGAPYLSGLLIGAEIAAAARTSDRIVVIGAEDLATRYIRAATLLGLTAEAAPRDCAAAGHLVLARAAGVTAID